MWASWECQFLSFYAVLARHVDFLYLRYSQVATWWQISKFRKLGEVVFKGEPSCESPSSMCNNDKWYQIVTCHKWVARDKTESHFSNDWRLCLFFISQGRLGCDGDHRRVNVENKSPSNNKASSLSIYLLFFLLYSDYSVKNCTKFLKNFHNFCFKFS